MPKSFVQLKILPLFVAALICIAGRATAAPRWVTAANIDGRAPVLLHFKRGIDLAIVPSKFIVDVSADNRFILYVNGSRVGTGPARGDLAHWRYETFDLAPHLKVGQNVITAEVWNALDHPDSADFKVAPQAQISAMTGFWLRGQGAAVILDSGPGWQVQNQNGHQFLKTFDHLQDELKSTWFVAGPGEAIDGSLIHWDWQEADSRDDSWRSVVDLDQANAPSPWTLVPDGLPPMTYTPWGVGPVVRSNLEKANGLIGGQVTIPANQHAVILIDQGEVGAAYPEFTISGGQGSQVVVTYSEALYDEDLRKGDRNEVGNRKIIGLEDKFALDGGKARTFKPLWWRTWRYMQIAITTGNSPATLNRPRFFRTGYPFEQKGYFDSDDKDLNKVWSIGWQTLKVNAHETYMDSAYWEQLQYVGDTRIENLISYAVSGDARLAEQAIDAFGNSQDDSGMINSAYPELGRHVIPTFGLIWINMMHDYLMHERRTDVLERNLPKARRVLAWYRPYLSQNGLLTRNPEWNFVDWVGDPALPADVFPSFDKASNTSCLTSLLYLGALRDAASLEEAIGDANFARDDKAQATGLTAAIRSQCWDERRGLFADDPSKTVFSQHANALAVLYDVAPEVDKKSVLKRVVAGHGTDAPDGILQASFYFSWYLAKAFDHAGLSDRYFDLIQTWKDLLKLNYTTWPESRGNPRSDSHAWSGHPTADLLSMVAGISSDAPGFQRILIEPHLGPLKKLDAASMTPEGLVTVSYRRTVHLGLTATITKPEALEGRFVWQGKSYALDPHQTTLRIP